MTRQNRGSFILPFAFAFAFAFGIKTFDISTHKALPFELRDICAQIAHLLGVRTEAMQSPYFA